MTVERPSRRTAITVLAVLAVSLRVDVLVGAVRVVWTDDDWGTGE